MKTILIVLLALSVAGCDQMTPANAAPAQPKKHAVKRPIPVHRFVQNTYNPDVAFDTQTGQICKTWTWEPMVKAKPDPVTGSVPQSSLGQFSPTCASIYAISPSQITEYEEDEK